MDKNTVISYKSDGGELVFRWPARGSLWFTGINGLQTEIDMTTSQSYGQAGSTISGQNVLPKTVTFNGALYGSNAREVQLLRDRILSVVAPQKQARVTFSLVGGESWFIDGYPKQTTEFSDGDTLQKFQFEFYVPYPFFRSGESKSYQLSGLRALWRTPFYTGGTFHISKYTEDAFKRVENSGNVEQSISLKLYASAEVTDPIIYNVDKGTFIAIRKVFKTGESMLISTFGADKDAGRAAVFVEANGTESNGFRLITPDSDLSMTVSPGGNIFMADASANKQNLRCTLITSGGERHSI